VAGGIHFFKFLIFDWWAEFGKIRRRVWLDFNSGAILMAVSNSFKVSFRLVCNSLFSLFWIGNETTRSEKFFKMFGFLLFLDILKDS